MALGAVLGVTMTACGGGGSGGGDGGDSDGGDSGPARCADDSDCDDGTFCNGAERCMPSSAKADANGCVPADESPCAEGQSCDESGATCLTECEVGGDADGDGHDAAECGGDDCDDSDPNRFPGNTELCDPDAHDEDCDPSTFGFRDADGDGTADEACCNEIDGSRTCGTDCNDANANVGPMAAEVCIAGGDPVDDDCDGMIDEGATVPCYPDADNDGYAPEEAELTMRCRDASRPEASFCPFDYTDQPADDPSTTDCNDGEFGINPGAEELCTSEEVDEDCDGTVNEESVCGCPSPGQERSCSDGGFEGRCGDGVQSCVSADGGGTRWGDCSISPIAEICNGEDDDCDGMVDDGVLMTCYEDLDDDGYAPAGARTLRACDCAEVTSTTVTDREPTTGNEDCNDDDPTIYPGATELCDLKDNDCSTGGGSDRSEDADGDGHAPADHPTCSGGPLPKDDCLDSNADVHPAQASFFGEPYCENGEPVQEIPDTGEPCCFIRLGDCPTEGITWDYDCDGTEEPAPANGCDPPSTTICDPDACNADNASGWSYFLSPPACGDPAERITSCGCSLGTCDRGSVTEPFTCR